MILAILVLYKQRLEQSSTFLSLFGSSAWPDGVHLLVYDNSPVPMHSPDQFNDHGGRVQYISDTSNPGVSKAYNTGVRIAKDLGDDFVLLLDQDTAFPQGAAALYVEAAKTVTDCRLFVPILDCDGQVLSPCWHSFSIYLPLRRIVPGRVSTRHRSILNSGACVAITAFEESGGFDENIPLYFSDHDFMRRYRAHFADLLVLNMVCSHNLSDKGPPDIHSSLVGFDYFCRGARHSIKQATDIISVLPMSLARLARLSLRFRSTAFLPVFLRGFLRR